MDVSSLVSTEYSECGPDTPASKLAGTFADPGVAGVVVRDGETGAVEGVITRRQLATSRRSPDEKARSLVRPVPDLAPDDDVREAAARMLDADARILPVFDGGQFVGVLTADDLLAAVKPALEAATVGQVATGDLHTVAPTATFGEALATMRDERVTHLPVVVGTDVVGILSLYDLIGLAVRDVDASQGGHAPGFDAHGGTGSSGSFRSHGGFGAREGERARMRDQPVRDLMTSPVRTVRRDETLATTVDGMAAVDGSSLVVVDDDGAPTGIVTKTDLLRALTRGAEGNRAVQIVGAALLDDVTYDDVLDVVDRFERVAGDASILDARIHLHEHDERLRGTPLILARVRLSTDHGLVVASGEGYGAGHAIREAARAVERQLRDAKSTARDRMRPDDYWERRFGWWLEG